MNHVAIDLGSKTSQVCMRGPDGALVLEKKHPTAKLGEWMRSWPPSRVILETGSEAFRIADAAHAAGHEVRVVPATLVRQLGVGERRMKTDERDARKLSEVSCRIELPSVRIPTEAARRVRSLLRSREMLVELRTKAVNHARGWMRQHLLKPGRGAMPTLPERIRYAATMAGLAIPTHIESVLHVIETLTIEVTLATKTIASEAKNHPVCRRLMTIPGIGPMSSLGFVAALDDRTRFVSAHRVQSFLGLTPGENSSSERQQRTGITKAGPKSVRRTLIQAAWVAWTNRPDEPMVRWAKQIAERRGKFIAIVALARKLAGIMFALWRDQTEYRARKSLMPQ